MTEPSDPPKVDPDAPEVDEAVPVVASEPPEPEAAGPRTDPSTAVVDAEPPAPDTAGPGTEVVPPEADADATEDRPSGSEPDSVAGTAGDQSGGGTSLARNVLEWLTILGGALVVALVVTRFLVQAFFIPSLSMYPALEEGDRVLVNKLSYRLHEIRRGDLIVFERPSDEGPGQVKDLIKRVVGLEGERIEARGGRVLIDGKPLPEPYLARDVRTTNLEPGVVPDGHVFVMGDNREDSRDSRFFGPLPEDLVIGRAFVKVWPLDDLELL